MCPIAFKIGALTIHWYGVMAALGFLAATFVLRLTRRRAGMSDDDVSNIMLIAMIAGLAGARIFYVVQFFDQFRHRLLYVFRIDQGGLVFYGGFLLAVGCLVFYAKRKKIDVVRMFDALAPGLALGHAFGRIGCFLHGCCFGKPAPFLGVRYPAGSAPALRYGEQALYPVQLVEAGANVVLFLFLLHLAKNGRRGSSLACYFISYGTLRILTEFLRGDNPRILGLFTPAQLIGLVLIPAGVIMLIRFGKNAAKEA